MFHYSLKKITLLIILVFCTTVTPQKNIENIYKKIQPLNLSSLTWQDEEWPNESFYDYLNRCFNYQANPQKIKKRKIVFKLFDSISQKSISHNYLYDIGTMEDLNLLAGKKENESYIAEILDRTHTELGRVFLYGLISNPINDIDKLKARQKIIKFFVDSDNVYTQLDTIYQQFASSENMLLSLWAQDGFLHSTQRRYFSLPFFNNINNALNRSSVSLELKSIWDHHQRVMFLISGLVAAIILPVHGLSNITGISLPNILERTAERLQGSGGKILALCASISNHPYFTAGISTLAGAFCALAMKEDYEWVRDNITLDNCLQKKMIHIAHFFRNIIPLATLIESNQELIHICPAAAKINKFMKTDFLTKDMQKLFNLFMSPTLQDKASIFSIQGQVLAAFKLIYDLKEKLEPLLMAIGEIDAYYSCAQLYKEFKNKKVQFCFTQYKIDNNPSILMTDFWNPLINPNEVISNTISLHGPNKRNMIVTGPNAGGKSTLIKAISINLILSQSIGISAAKNAEITPFYSIATYLNITDDIAAGNSLFKAQVLRAQEMINLVEQTPNTQFSFVALDEMFNGTSAKESMAAAYSVVKYIGQYQNNISIIATHFPLLTNLENESSAFANYKVSVNIDEQKGIHYPFKLEPGISTQHIALDILKQEGYYCTIIAEATKILKMINN